jgi:hypothetical protein
MPPKLADSEDLTIEVVYCSPLKKEKETLSKLVKMKIRS